MDDGRGVCKSNSGAQVSLSIGLQFRRKTKQVYSASANFCAVNDRAQANDEEIMVVHTG